MFIFIIASAIGADTIERRAGALLQQHIRSLGGIGRTYSYRNRNRLFL